MDKHLYTVSEEEKYYFDLRGYLVVRNALTAEEVSECNAAIDHFARPDLRLPWNPRPQLKRTARHDQAASNSPACWVGRPPTANPFAAYWSIPPSSLASMNSAARAFRLDHGPLLISATKGTEGHYLHGAGEPFSPATWYHQQNGKIYCRGITVAWQLTDCNPGDGGFAVIPGSHKTCEPTPPEIRSLAEYGELVVQPAPTRRRRPLLRRDRHPRHPAVERQKSTALRALQIRLPGRGPSHGQILHSTGALRHLDRRTHARTTSRPLRARRPPQGPAPAGIRRPKNLDCGELKWMHTNATSGISPAT